jgi:hypothetical protein
MGRRQVAPWGRRMRPRRSATESTIVVGSMSSLTPRDNVLAVFEQVISETVRGANRDYLQLRADSQAADECIVGNCARSRVYVLHVRGNA